MSAPRLKFVAAILTYALLCKVLPYVLYRLNAAGFPIDPAQSWYPWNFSPVAAVCVFCGAFIPRRGWSLLLPLGMMILADVLIDLITHYEYATLRNHFVQLWVYGCVLLTVCGGFAIRSRPRWIRAMPVGILGDILFFVVTNFAVWISGYVPGETAPLYPLSADGLAACYLAALPFFGRTVASTFVYTALFFSPFGLRAAGVIRNPEGLDLQAAPAYQPTR